MRLKRRYRIYVTGLLALLLWCSGAGNRLAAQTPVWNYHGDSCKYLYFDHDNEPEGVSSVYGLPDGGARALIYAVDFWATDSNRFRKNWLLEYDAWGSLKKKVPIVVPRRHLYTGIHPYWTENYALIPGAETDSVESTGHPSLYKVDADFNLLFYRTYDFGEEIGEFYSIRPLDNGEFICCGWAVFADNRTQALLARVDSTGNLHWWDTVGVASSLYNYAIEAVPHPQGGYVFAGYRSRPGYHLQTRAFVTRVDETGYIYWDKVLFSYDVLWQNATSGWGGICPAGSRGFLVYGHDEDSTQGILQAYNSASCLLYTWDGDTIWKRTQPVYDPSNYSVNFWKGYLLPDGGFMLGGMSDVMYNYCAMSMRLSAQGDSIFTHHYRHDLTSTYCYTISPLQTRDGGFILGGFARPDTARETDAWLCWLDGEGLGRECPPEPPEGVPVTDLYLGPPAPNPVRDIGAVEVRVPAGVPAVLRAWDAAGRAVWQRDCPAGAYWVPIPEGLATGVYLLRLQQGDAVRRQKLLVN